MCSSHNFVEVTLKYESYRTEKFYDDMITYNRKSYSPPTRQNEKYKVVRISEYS